jgi:hypothetical protein
LVAALPQLVTVPGQPRERRGEDLRLILFPGEAAVQIGPRCRDGSPSSRRQLQYDPWLVLPPEHVDPGGELAADAMGTLVNPDEGSGEK